MSWMEKWREPAPLQRELRGAIVSRDLSSLNRLLERFKIHVKGTPECKRAFAMHLFRFASRKGAPVAFCELILSFFKPCDESLLYQVDALSQLLVRNEDFRPEIVELYFKYSASEEELAWSAAENCDSVEVFEELFLRRGSINLSRLNGMTLLLTAISVNNIKAAIFLIRNGADVNRSQEQSNNYDWCNPLTSAICNITYHPELIEALVEHGAYLDPILPSGYTPLVMFLRNRCLLQQPYCIAYNLIKWGSLTVYNEHAPFLLETVQICLLEDPDFELVRLLYVSGMDVGKLKFELCDILGDVGTTQSADKLPKFLTQCRRQPRSLRGLSCVAVRLALYWARDGRSISNSIDALDVAYMDKDLLHLKE